MKGYISHLLEFLEHADKSGPISGILLRYVDSIPPILAGVRGISVFVFLNGRFCGGLNHSEHMTTFFSDFFQVDNVDRTAVGRTEYHMLWNIYCDAAFC